MDMTSLMAPSSTMTTPSQSPRTSPMLLLAAADAIQKMDQWPQQAEDEQHEKYECDKSNVASGSWRDEEKETFEAVCSLLTHGFRRDRC
jgi:hypothetical protein